MAATSVGSRRSVLPGTRGSIGHAQTKAQGCRLLVHQLTPCLPLVLGEVISWLSQLALQASQETMLPSPPRKRKVHRREGWEREDGYDHLP